MPDQVKQVLDNIKARWNALTRPQQYKLLGVVAVVIVAIALTLFLTFRVQYDTIMSGSSLMEIQPIAAVLNDEGIRNQITNNGSALMVDRSRVNDAVLIATVRGVAPMREDFTWAHALESGGLATTESQRNLMSIRALETQIGQQLAAFQNITSAVVTLNVPPANRVFRVDVPQASAFVTVITTREIPLTEGRNMALAVARSVQGLNLEEVIIMDQDMRTVFSSDMDLQGDPIGNVEEIRNRHRNSVEWALNRMFTHLFDEVHTAVNLVFDDAVFSEEIAEIFRAPDGFDGGILFESRDSRAEIEGSTAGFEPGLMPNAATIQGYAMGSNTPISAAQRERDTRYHVDRIQTISQSGPGWVIPDASSVALVAYVWREMPQHHWLHLNPGTEVIDWEIYRNENEGLFAHINDDFDMASITGLVAAAAGIPVENVEVTIMQGWNFINTPPRVIDFPLIVVIAVLLLLLAMLAYALLRRQKQADENETEAEPELSVEDLLVSTQLEEAKEEAVEQLEEIDYFKENEVKRNIDKFVNEKPEAVAALLRNWLNVEEW